MLHLNMGHNDIDYENKTNKELSFAFENETQNKLIIESLLWLADSNELKERNQSGSGFTITSL